MLQRIDFSETTHKLHRNLVVSAALIIAIEHYQIKVTNVASSGIQFENLTTQVLLTVLVVVLLYHIVAYSLRAFEEYRFWEFQLTAREVTYMGGGVGVIELIKQLEGVKGLLTKIVENGGAIADGQQTVFTVQDAASLKRATAGAVTYIDKFKNFPLVMRLRFWLWDLGLPAIIAAAALVAKFTPYH